MTPDLTQDPPFVRKVPREDPRTPEQVRQHYHVERELADRLRASSAEERQHLCSELYEELFRRVPQHPQLTVKADSNSHSKRIGWQVALLKKFLAKDQTFLEVGGGDCALAIKVAPLVAESIGCDVVSSLSSDVPKPSNFRFLQTKGSSFELDDGSVDVVYSNQLMEHLHVEDARAQLEDIFRVLRKGGRYVCITPNRHGGPWDVSMYFDREATGFHMKEYTVRELESLFREAGFTAVTMYGGGKGLFFRLPVWPVKFFESVLGVLPIGLATSLALSVPGRAALGIRIVGTK